MITRRALCLSALALPFLPAAVVAQPLFTENGVAIRGFDPVAYFSQRAPVRGTPDHAADWGGATWHFASAENRATFLADPGAYAPQYGGYCAWAVARGYTAAIDPQAWRIVDGRLYLNFSPRIQRRWEQDIAGNITRGDANWPSLQE